MLTKGYHDVPDGHIAMVVTLLEMRQQAPLRGAALPKGLRFDRLSPNLNVYRDLYYRIGQDWLWFSRLVMPDAELEALLNYPEKPIWTLYANDQPEALLELDFSIPGECSLAYFGLTPTLIGSGAGAYLMDRAIELAWARDISRFHLHTCTADSPGALSFYLRSGFTAYGRRIEIAEDPRITGILTQDLAPHMPRTA